MRDRDLAGHQIRREVLHRDLDVPQHEWSIAIPNLVRGLEVRHRVHVLEHVHETAAVLVHDLQAASELLTAFDDAGFQRLDVALDERERLAQLQFRLKKKSAHRVRLGRGGEEIHGCCGGGRGLHAAVSFLTLDTNR